MSKLEGTLKDAAERGQVYARITNTTGKPCDGAFMCESNACGNGVCVSSTDVPQPVYDYRKLNDDRQATVECACHGSVFDVETGEPIDGPAQDPVAVHQARLVDGDEAVMA